MQDTSIIGTLHTHNDIPSQYITPRRVDVWCPPKYANDNRRYPVIYMHDGQNLFDPDLSFIGVDWGIDEAMMRLIDHHATDGAIVVGIWNTELRRREYMPQRPLEQPEAHAIRSEFAANLGGEPLSDDYLSFLVHELKPIIDATYRTMPDREQTFIMGSSMGGLISLYALCQYPHVFGGAACLSTHWVIGKELLVDEMAAMLPPVGNHRLYFDYGTATLDAEYEPYQQRMDKLVAAEGYVEGRDVLTLKFENADHSERAWRERVDIPLRWLLAGKA